jgi:HlyD family secretion protein
MPQEQTRSSLKWLWWRLAVLAVGLVIFAVYRSRHGVVAVRTARVSLGDIVSDVSTNGKVAPLADFQAHAPLAGIVKKLLVHLGEHVQNGQELVQMDDSDARRELATAEANLASATANLNAMQHGGTQDERLSETADLSTAQTQVQQDTLALASLQKLQAQGAASANEVAAAQQRLDAAKARVAQLQTRRSGRYSGDDLTAQKAQVAQAQAAVAAARTVFAGVDIRAPFAGTVYAVPVAQYQFVPAGETLLQLADLTKLQIKAYFDEPEIGQLKPGQPVTIKWPAKPLQLWHGHVVQVPTTITAYGGTRNVGECLIAVDDANGDLLPNTNVTVRVIEQHSDNVMILPREALHTDGTDNYVYRVVKEHLVKTPIKLGKVVNLTRFEIEGGLNPGDTVALRAITEADLTDGLHVKTQP